MIKIATDTIADLPVEVVKQHNIHIIPAWVYLKTGKVRTDSLDMHELFERLADEPGIPRTEPLSEGEYSEIFTGLIGRDDTLIVVSASGHISRVYEIAGGAAKSSHPRRSLSTTAAASRCGRASRRCAPRRWPRPVTMGRPSWARWTGCAASRSSFLCSTT
jgi:fatty acid-binding protein DegV